MGENGLNTNLASEFYVLSMLHRIGCKAYLTLGNKKSVDVVIERGEKILTVDVKGLQGTSSFPIDNWDKKHKNHFLIFVSFIGKITDPSCLPEVYIVPSLELEKKHEELNGKSLIYKNPKGNRIVIQLSKLRKLKNKYKNKWNYLK